MIRQVIDEKMLEDDLTIHHWSHLPEFDASINRPPYA